MDSTITPKAEADQAYRIRVDVETSYLEEQSDPRERKFVFSYTITLRNEGSVPAKLLTRHWIITDANGEVREVRGPGVVGEQPVLAPGESFQYTSGCPLTTSSGMMHGTYQMVTEEGTHFDVEIAPFKLREVFTVH